MKVASFRDLMNGQESAEIACLYTGKTVRKLSMINADSVLVDAIIGPKVTIPLDTPITYEPWVFDRGNMLFPAPDELRKDFGNILKICGEGDRITYCDGTDDTVLPA